MRSRPARIALWMGAGVLGVLVLLVCAVLIIPNTDGGRSFIAHKLSEMTDGKVRIAGIHGTFPAALDLDRLELRDSQGLWLWADHVSLRWSPSALINRHVDVDSLHVALLHVERAPLPDPNKKPSASSSSVPRTDLKDLTVNTLELGKALAGDPASLTVNGNAHLLSLEDADAHLTAKRTSGDGHYEITAHLDPESINATVKLQEPANGPLENLIKVPGLGALNALIELKGPRNAEDLQLSVDAGPLQARASGRIDLKNSTADLNYTVSAPAMSPMAGLSWQRVDLEGRLQGAFNKPTTAGRLVIEQLQAPGGAQLALLDAQVEGDKGFVALKAGIDGLQIPGSAPRLFADSRLTLNGSIRLDDPRRPLQLTATHRLFELVTKAVTAGAQSADLTLRIPDLKPFSSVSGAALRGDADLGAHVDYSPSLTKLTANLNSHLDGGAAAWAGLVRGGVTQLRLTAEMTQQDFALKDLQLTARAVSLSAEARADRAGEQRMNLRFKLGLPDLARVSPALAGNLKASGSVAGPREKLSTDMRLTTSLSVHGSARGTVTARVQASGLPKAPDGFLEAGGELDGAPLRVNMQIQPVNNGGYHAIIRRADWKSAHADGDITLGKTVADARGKATVRVARLSDFNTLAGSSLSGSIDGRLAMNPQGRRPAAQLDFQAQNVTARGMTANAHLNANGPMDALQVTLQADSPEVAGQPARIDTGTTLNLTRKQLQLASLEASWHGQELRLLNPARIDFARELRVQQLRLGIQDARIEVDGQLSPTLNLHAAVRQIKPDLVNAFMPDTLASGTVNAEATVRGTTAAPTGNIHFQVLDVRSMNATARGIPAADLRADANLRGDTADVNAQLTAGPNSKLAVTGRAPLSASGMADLKLAGNLDLALANPILEAGGRHVAGTIAIDTTVTGKAQNPQVTGTVRLANGSVRDYTQGVSLTDITGQLSGDRNELRIDQLTAKAAPGNLSIQGRVGILEPKIPVDIHLTAKDAQPVASNLVTANLDADIKVTGTAREQMDVNGKVHLNRANINIPSGMPPGVAVLDVERDGEKPEKPPEKPVVINLHVDVDAPNRILISGHGLDAEMGGNLKVRGTTAAPAVSGGFELQRGFFNLANSKLTFTNGTVTFSGTGVQKKLDPSLDFTAQTQAAEVTAVIHITGLADAPRIELSSTPELPQDEILARLLFGEPAAQLTALQLVQTGAALASMRSGGGGSSLNPLTKIQKALGLDRLSVGGGGGSGAAGSTAANQQSAGTSVEAGRYISDRVYVGVKESTTGAGKVNVDVDLTKGLKLQASLGNGTTTAQGVTPENDPGSSIGLAYQFEY